MRRSSHIALVFLLAFLFQSFLPFFATYSLPDTNRDIQELTELFGERVLICTEDGFQWISWEDLADSEHRPSPHTNYACAMCYVAAHQLYVPLPDVVEILDGFAYLSSIDRLFTEISVSFARGLISPHASRAPPFSFIA